MRSGDTVLLEGNLGVGKTTFVKGLVQALNGSVTDVQSPTYTLMHIYDADLPIVHVDAYRLSQFSDLEALGFSEYAEQGIACIEWPSKIDYTKHSNEDAWILQFEHAEEGGRRVSVQTPRAIVLERA